MVLLVVAARVRAARAAVAVCSVEEVRVAVGSVEGLATIASCKRTEVDPSRNLEYAIRRTPRWRNSVPAGCHGICPQMR